MKKDAPSRALRARRPACGICAVALLLLSALGTAGCTSLTRQDAATRTTVDSGRWSDETVWGGKPPRAGDKVIIGSGHRVTFDQSSFRVAGLTVEGGGALVFASRSSATLESRGNVIIEGKLVMNPSSPNIDHLIRFTGINETAFTGGGMQPIESDVGLWVTGAGLLNLTGSRKTSWVRLAESAQSGTSQITLASIPLGWRAGDEIALAPTRQGHIADFSTATIATVDGATISLTAPLSQEHPAVYGNGFRYTAEVMNLTRNVRIEGLPPNDRWQANATNGRAHVFINNSSPAVHKINYVGIRYMGPRQAGTAGSSDSDVILGRYGLHFHMSGDNVRGSTVEGTIVRETDAHAFVPHASHGITFRDTISYDTAESAYWWDSPAGDCIPESTCATDANASHDIVYDHTIAAWVKAHPDSPDAYRLSAYSIVQGLRNVIKNSTAVGVDGTVDASGFQWPEGVIAAPWTFDSNTAHNNAVNGIFWWIVDSPLHLVTNFHSYHNSNAAIDHGSYLNNTHYINLSSYKDGFGTEEREQAAVNLRASSRSTPFGLVISDAKIDGGGIVPNALLISDKILEPAVPTQLPRWQVQGIADRPVRIDNPADGGVNEGYFQVDIVCWEIGAEKREMEPEDVHIVSMMPNSQLRVQRKDGTAFQLHSDGAVANIPKFSECGASPL
jgi:G8 domain